MSSSCILTGHRCWWSWSLFHGRTYHGQGCSDLDMIVKTDVGRTVTPLSPLWTGLDRSGKACCCTSRAPHGLLPSLVSCRDCIDFKSPPEGYLRQPRRMRRTLGQHHQRSGKRKSGLCVRCEGPGEWHLSLQLATIQSGVMTLHSGRWLCC